MIKHEERARQIHKQGNNCSYSLYTAYEEDNKLDGNIPLPRSEAGKCGAVIAAEKILKELGKEDKIEKFEKAFLSEFGNITCAQLMKKDRRCNDYVGKSAELIDKLINEKE